MAGFPPCFLHSSSILSMGMFFLINQNLLDPGQTESVEWKSGCLDDSLVLACLTTVGFLTECCLERMTDTDDESDAVEEDEEEEEEEEEDEEEEREDEEADETRLRFDGRLSKRMEALPPPYALAATRTPM